MIKKDANKLVTKMIGLNSEVVKHPGRPKWDMFHVEYSELVAQQGDDKRLVEVRRVFPPLVGLK